MFLDSEIRNPAKREAVQYFQEAYDAQMRGEYAQAISLYKKSIGAYPTAEAYTFLGWTYSFQGDLDLAITECLAAIAVDSTFGNPYNDIGSYLVAKGNLYDAVRWFKLAMQAPRYDAREYPHFNLGNVYEQRGDLVKAAKHYGHAIEQSPDYKEAYRALKRIQAKLS